ncbi:hypothetical protein VCRA217O17_250038 [Vibrio crassostreae]|nr:hypothetical protein [Vibrio crassostreae]CAK3814849.1 hypothetical protein VCRA217O17_250038 [Vibrio crassostreae]
MSIDGTRQITSNAKVAEIEFSIISEAFDAGCKMESIDDRLKV